MCLLRFNTLLYLWRWATAPGGLGGWTTGLTIFAIISTSTLNVLFWDDRLWLLVINAGKWDYFHMQPGGFNAGASTQVTPVAFGTAVLLVWAANSLWQIRGALNILNMNRFSVASPYTHFLTVPQEEGSSPILPWTEDSRSNLQSNSTARRTQQRRDPRLEPVCFEQKFYCTRGSPHLPWCKPLWSHHTYS